MLEVGAGHIVIRPRLMDWWVVAVNQFGSVLFFLAGLAAFVRPATSQTLDIALVNWGTFAGRRLLRDRRSHPGVRPAGFSPGARGQTPYFRWSLGDSNP